MNQDGEVLRFDAERGFGFIGTPDGRRDIFFHVRDFQGSDQPRVGQRVRFERIDVGGKGPRAMAVQPLGQGGPKATAAPARHTPRQPASATTTGQAPRRAPSPSPSPAHKQTQGQRQTAAGARPASAGRPRARGADRAPSRPMDGQPWLFALALLVWAGLLWLVIQRGGLPVSTPALLGGLALLNLATFAAYAIDKRAAEQGRWRTAESTLHTLALAGGWPGAWAAQRLLRHKSRKLSFLTTYVVTVLLNLGALALLWRYGVGNTAWL